MWSQRVSTTHKAGISRDLCLLPGKNPPHPTGRQQRVAVSGPVIPKSWHSRAPVGPVPCCGNRTGCGRSVRSIDFVLFHTGVCCVGSTRMWGTGRLVGQVSLARSYPATYLPIFCSPYAKFRFWLEVLCFRHGNRREIRYRWVLRR
jgi:hypothetical protein